MHIKIPHIVCIISLEKRSQQKVCDCELFSYTTTTTTVLVLYIPYWFFGSFCEEEEEGERGTYFRI